MQLKGYIIIFLLAWGLFSFLAFVVRSLYRLITSGKRQAENELHYKRIAEEAEENRKIRDENRQKDIRIRELEDKLCILAEALEKLEAASAPLPDRFYGGELAYDYRDVPIYVPDENFDKLVLGNPLYVAKSEYNRYDKDAIGLKYGGVELAYLCRGKIQEMALDYISRGDGGYSIISYIDKPSKTAKIHLGFYKGCNFDDE